MLGFQNHHCCCHYHIIATCPRLRSKKWIVWVCQHFSVWDEANACASQRAGGQLPGSTPHTYPGVRLSVPASGARGCFHMAPVILLEEIKSSIRGLVNQCCQDVCMEPQDPHPNHSGLPFGLCIIRHPFWMASVDFRIKVNE